MLPPRWIAYCEPLHVELRQQAKQMVDRPLFPERRRIEQSPVVRARQQAALTQVVQHTANCAKRHTSRCRNFPVWTVKQLWSR